MRYLLLLLTATVFLVALHLASLYAFVPYATIGAELAAANREGWAPILPQPLPQLAYSTTRYAALRGTIGVVLTGAALGLLAFGRKRNRQQGRRLAHDTRRAWQSVRRFWQALGRGEKYTALGLLGLLLALRCWLMQLSALNPDELVGYDYFIRPGTRITAGFYTLPNNHILYNLLAGGLIRGLAPTGIDPDLLLRLPSVVLGFGGIGLVYAVLARLTSFRVATFSLALLQLVPVGFAYTVSGRGYGLQDICIYTLFLAVLVLLRGPACHRLAWTVAVLASLAGFYLIPTFLYPFLSLGAGLLAGGLLRGRQGRALAVYTAITWTGVLGLTALLYLPVGLLSGWPALLANPYVARLSFSAFWHDLGPYYLWGTLGALLGAQVVTAPLLGLLLSGGLLLIRRWGQPGHWPVAALAWAGTVGPLPLLMVQRVYAPPRTLHYLVFFVVLLAALVAEAVVRRTRLPARLAVLLLALGVAGYAAYRLPRQAQSLVADRAYRFQALHAYHWLAAQQPHRIFTDSYGYYLYIHHLALKRPLPMQLLGQRPQAREYDYLLLQKNRPLPVWAARQPYRLAYQHADIAIYRLARRTNQPPADTTSDFQR